MGRAPKGLWPFAAQAAIFDFDGTLADTAGIWHEVDTFFLQKRGLQYTEDYSRRLAALGFARGAQYTIELYGLSETVDEICDEWNDMGSELYRDTVVFRPGAERYIRALKAAGIPCALATTNDKSVLGNMRKIDVYGLFDACVHGAEVKRGKDHPDIYMEAACRLGVDPKECLVFEDIVPALFSAKRAGMLACGVRANDQAQDIENAREVADLWLEDWTDIDLRQPFEG